MLEGKDGWRDRYGKEREKYYNRSGQDIEAIEQLNIGERNCEEKLIRRERDTQR